MRLVHHERLAERVRAAGVDVVLASRRENVRYLTDMADDLPSALDLRIAVATRGDPFEIVGLVAPRGISGWIPDWLVAGSRVWLYGSFYAMHSTGTLLDPAERAVADLLASAPGEGDSFESAVAALIDALPSGSRLAWDEPSIGAIARDLGHAPAADGAALLQDVRQVKTTLEVERLQHAAEVAESVERRIIDAARPGEDWAEIAASVPAAVAARGATFGFLTGGAGWQSGFVYAPRSMAIEAGHLIRLDIGLSVDGYWSDTGRSVSVGAPSPLVAARYAAIRAGADAAFARVRPGVTFEAVYDAAMAVIRPAIEGYERHHCGHAIGLRAYDGPLVAPGHATVLETGMVLNIEVPIYDIGWGGLQLEDTVVVEPDGARSLTRLDRGLFVVPA